MQDEYGFDSGQPPRIWPELTQFPKSFKWFASLMLVVSALCYLSLLGSIWNDTQMNPDVIREAYAMMDPIELTQHTFLHLFWFFGIFSITGMLFLLTSYTEKTKRIFAILVPILIISDLAAQWLIQYHDLFTPILFVSGALLAASFLSMFVLIQNDLWIRKGAGNKS